MSKKRRLHPLELAAKNASFDVIGHIQQKSKMINSKREDTPAREMQPVTEPSERATYRMKCRNYDGYNGLCYKKSGSNGHCFWDYGCDGVCRRMKKWDKEHGQEGEKFKIREIM